MQCQFPFADTHHICLVKKHISARLFGYIRDVTVDRFESLFRKFDDIVCLFFGNNKIPRRFRTSRQPILARHRSSNNRTIRLHQCGIDSNEGFTCQTIKNRTINPCFIFLNLRLRRLMLHDKREEKQQTFQRRPSFYFYIHIFWFFFSNGERIS